ncbi:hypothetical protein [Paenibacillus sp. FSL K6-2524]
MTLPELARIWFDRPQQHAIIVRNIKAKSVGTTNKDKVTTG